jgi:16S rRNA (guanine527-N7)-methyltransferase
MNLKNFEAKLLKQKILLSSEQKEKMIHFAQMVWDKGRLLGLTGRKSLDEIYTKDFLDSFLLFPYAQKAHSLLEVGSGAGFPAIPLKILLQEIPFVLVEAKKKAVLFLEEVKASLALKGIKIFWDRAEALSSKQEFQKQFDLVLGRAVAPMFDFFLWTHSFVSIGGRIIFQKGKRLDEELSKAMPIFKKKGFEIETIFPGLEGAQKIVVVKNVSRETFFTG